MHAMPQKTNPMNKYEAELREIALGYPGAYEEFPWGERVIKVNAKVFVFLGKHEDQSFGLSAKLPHSREAALMLPFASPTGYGLGKAGWVNAEFAPNEKPPLELLRQWIDESYRAIAPKKLVAQLDGSAPAPSTAKPARARKTASRAKPTSPAKKAAPRKRSAART
jgi:predicted DNA-binding protein (MmcQ/YjbR family)